MFNLFPGLFELKLASVLHGTSAKILLVGILVVSALISLPISTLVNKYGMKRSFWISFVILAISITSLFVFSGTVLIIFMMIVFAVAFAALSVSSLPLAIHHANHYEKVLCVGIFFSGVALPDGILGAIQAF
jgi:MFS family permease